MRIALALALIATGCTTAAMPRSAEVARPGHLTGEALLPFTYAPGTARGHARDRVTGLVEPVTIEGSSAAVIHAPTPLVAAMPVWFDGAVRVGVFEPCEVGPILGLFRQGAELRCGLWQQPDGAPVSMAASGAIAYQPFFDEPGWLRVGLDLSRRWSAVQISIGGYASYGSSVHHIAEVPPEYGEERDHHVEPAVRARLHGWRFSLPIGITMEPDREIGFTWGVVPFFSIDEAARDLECQQCSAIALDRFEVPWGVVFTIGASFGTEDPLF